MAKLTFIIQTAFDGGTVYGVDTARMMLPTDRPDDAIASLWQIIDHRGLVAVEDGDFTRTVSFNPAHVLSVQTLG